MRLPTHRPPPLASPHESRCENRLGGNTATLAGFALGARRHQEPAFRVLESQFVPIDSLVTKRVEEYVRQRRRIRISSRRIFQIAETS